MRTAHQGRRRHFVLVHGAYHGGWCWRRVSDLLMDGGDRVLTATCTGMGERSHLLSPAVSLETWVEDVVSLIGSEELEHVVLVGHSFGGRIISGVADRIPDRLRHLVYLDAVLPFPGLSNAASLPPDLWRQRRGNAIEVNGARCIPPPEPGYFGVTDAADARWVAQHLSPMPVALMEGVLALRHPLANGVPATYIRCTEPASPLMEPAHRHTREHGWWIREIATGHNAMISAPEDVVRLLREASDSP